MSEPDGSGPAVELVGVSKYFDHGAVRALDGVNLTVETGEGVAVTGPSGCGKSTMLHLIAALETPTSGTVRVGGTDLHQVSRLAAYRRQRVGMVFQMHNLLPQLSALANVEVAMIGTGRSREERRQRAWALLADVDLAGRERRLPTKLSGGERQRVAIARALANEPDLLLADEPTGSLDGESIGRVLGLFADLRRSRRGLTIIVVTHDARVAATADRIVHLRDGQLVDGRSPATASGPDVSAAR